ncbi:MAG: hypothetical protein Q9183_005910, partial [Haloplaca sp. 2 TL-2023]
MDAAFEEYFATETQSEVECDSEECKRSRETKRCVIHLSQGPDILITQLSRFQPGEKGEYEKKIQRVSYNEILSLSRYVKNEVPLKYRLLAVILHTGTLDGGHYITIGKTPGAQWAKYNDKMVQQSSLNEALGLSNSEFTPYLLFWQKEPLEAPAPSLPMSRKRARQDDQEAPEENGRSSPKSPRHETPPTSLPPRHRPFSSIWPMNWLFGGEQYREAAEKKLAECKDQHNLKDAEIGRLRDDNETMKNENRELKKL